MVVVFRLISFDDIASVIDLDVILFLVGMFSLVSLANSSRASQFASNVVYFHVL